jgi:hypothetical protein
MAISILMKITPTSKIVLMGFLSESQVSECV